MIAKMTISCALVLIVVGIGPYLAAGGTSPTALIPMLIGGLLLLTGIGTLSHLARFYRRAMLGATITALVGFLGAVGSLMSRVDIADPEALASKIALMVLCGGLLVLYTTSLLRLNKPIDHTP